jgi:hypothetical protein
MVSVTDIVAPATVGDGAARARTVRSGPTRVVPYDVLLVSAVSSTAFAESATTRRK